MSPATPVAPCDFVVFGGTGDLAVRKLLPALYLRDRDGQLLVNVVEVKRANDPAHGNVGQHVAEIETLDACGMFVNRLPDEVIHRDVDQVRQNAGVIAQPEGENIDEADAGELAVNAPAPEIEGGVHLPNSSTAGPV